MNKKLRFAFVIIAFLAFFLSACGGGGTRLTTVKSPKPYKGEPFKKMMILAIAKNPESTAMFEDALAKAMDNAGTEAVAASTVLPTKTKITGEIVLATAKKEGVDAVLVTHLVRKGQKIEDIPVTPVGTRSTFYGNSFDNYYPVVYSYINVTRYPDQQVKQTFVRLKTVFYEVQNREALWSASSESVDPKSVDQMVRQLSPKIIKSLEGYGLIN